LFRKDTRSPQRLREGRAAGFYPPDRPRRGGRVSVQDRAAVLVIAGGAFDAHIGVERSDHILKHAANEILAAC
jgi:hypothetical protein